MPTRSAIKYYRRRLVGSPCRGKTAKLCRKNVSCRNTRRTEKKAGYCRKRKNTHRKR